jgi:hypothetical protein
MLQQKLGQVWILEYLKKLSKMSEFSPKCFVRSIIFWHQRLCICAYIFMIVHYITVTLFIRQYIQILTIISLLMFTVICNILPIVLVNVCKMYHQRFFFHVILFFAVLMLGTTEWNSFFGLTQAIWWIKKGSTINIRREQNFFKDNQKI